MSRKFVALLACSLLVGFAVVELGLRAFVPLHFAAQARSRYDLDPDLIYRMKPHTSISWASDDFVEVSHTNALGMRGPEVSAKRPGEVRILALGDSFSTDQSYAYFLRAGLVLEPDVVIVGIHCSDVSDNYESPLFDVADGRLVSLGARVTRMYRFGTLLRGAPAMLQRSHVFALLLATLDAHHPQSARPDVVDLAAWSREKIRLEVSDMTARGRPHDVAVTAVLMPCKKDRDEYGDLENQLAAEGISVLDSSHEIAASQERDAYFFPSDPHLNATGNAALATAVASFLERDGLLSRRSARSR